MENHASMKKTKSKSIKKNIIIAVTLLFLFIIFSLSLMFYKITYDELINQLKSNLSELVKASKMTMENRIDGELKILETMARIDIIEDEKVSIEEKATLDILDVLAEEGISVQDLECSFFFYFFRLPFFQVPFLNIG